MYVELIDRRCYVLVDADGISMIESLRLISWAREDLELFIR